MLAALEKFLLKRGVKEGLKAVETIEKDDDKEKKKAEKKG